MEAKRFKTDNTVNTSSDFLTILNDDCIRKIFEYVTVEDMAAASQCCRRLNRIANSELTHRFRSTEMELTSVTCPAFKRFAGDVRNLNLKLPRCGVNKMSKVLGKCPILDKLNIEDLPSFEIFSSRTFANALAPVSEFRVHTVSSKSTSTTRNAAIKAAMERCVNLEKLSIGWTIPVEFFQVRYPKLRDLRLSADQFNVPDEHMTEFFRNHQTIKTLYLKIKTNKPVTDLSSVSLLRNLAYLSIESDAKSVILPKFTDMPSLRTVFLARWGINEVPCLMNLKRANIEQLEIVLGMERFTDSHLKDLGGLTRITSFELQNCVQQELSLPGIIDFIQKCPNLKQLNVPGFQQSANGHDQWHKKFRSACKNGKFRIYVKGGSDRKQWSISRSANIVPIIRRMLATDLSVSSL